MQPHVFTLLLRSALIQERLTSLEQHHNPSAVTLLRLKSLKMQIKDRIRRSRQMLPPFHGNRRLAAS